MAIEKYPFNKSSTRVATARDFFPVLKTFVVPILPDPMSLISYFKKIFVPLTVGGGVSKIEHIRTLLLSGADKVSINSAAVKDNNFVRYAADKYGSQCIVVAVDAKKNDAQNKWEVYTHGGRINTEIDVLHYVERIVSLGAGELLITSMEKDGTRSGFDNILIKKITDIVNVPVIASGGVGNLQHLVDGIKLGHADAVLAASIFHFGEYTINEAKQYMKEQGINVR